MKAEAVLAWMLSLQPPGASPYSAISIAEPVVCHTIWTKGCRRETSAEALPRYWTIAQSVASVAPGDERLTRAVLATIFHESSFRRDVHSGVGRFAIGDNGRAHCLGQVLRKRRSSAGRVLLGTGRAPTDRCVAAVAAYLDARKNERPRAWARRYIGPSAPKCSITARVYTFRRLATAPTPLTAEIRKLLRLSP